MCINFEFINNVTLNDIKQLKAFYNLIPSNQCTSQSQTQPQTQSQSLSNGAIAGIVVGCIVVTLSVALGISICNFRLYPNF